MVVRFWGVRGSLPAPGPETVRYGGNTLCVELRCGPHLLILDAGSGIRSLGAALAARDAPVHADILLSHTHLDHICGLPFFAPMFDPKARIRLWAGHLGPPSNIADVLALSWRGPLFPDIESEFRAHIEYHDFSAGDDLSLRDELGIRTTTLRHPGNAVGYRIESGGASVCYITDTEHPADGPDDGLRGFVAGADIMIYDSSYTEAEYQTRLGWGHSTWQAGADLADAAGVRQLVLFHHDPSHDDAAMDAIAEAAAKRRPGTWAATEGATIVLGAASAPE